MNAHTLNRSAVDLWLKGARLPLSVVETVTGRAGKVWPGSLAFDKVASTVRTGMGHLTGDEELVAAGRLQETAAAKRYEAVAKKAEAEELRARAHQQADERKGQIEETRETVEDRAVEQELQLEAERSAAEREVEQRASRRRAATRKATQARQKSTDRKQTRAQAKIAQEEAEALRMAEQAVEAEGAVLDLDRAVRAKKTARKSG